MAYDAYLKLEGIGTGNGQEFALESFSFGVSNSATAGGSASGEASGKVSLHDFSITKKIDSASPGLFEAAVEGKSIASATLTLKGEAELTTITFSDLIIANFKFDENLNATGGAAAPMESVSFNFQKVEYEVGGSKVGGTGSSVTYDLGTATTN